MANFDITPEMIVVWGQYFGMTAITDVPGIIGGMNGLAAGMGELPAGLVDAEATREMFAKLRSLYFAAKGVPEPAYSVVDAPVVAEEVVAPVVEEAPAVAEEVVSGEEVTEVVAE